MSLTSHESDQAQLSLMGIINSDSKIQDSDFLLGASAIIIE